MTIREMMESSRRFAKDNPSVSLVRRVDRNHLFMPNAHTFNEGYGMGSFSRKLTKAVKKNGKSRRM